MVFIHIPVRQYQNVCSVFICLVNFHEQALQSSLQLRAFIISDRNNRNPESFFFHFFDLQHICICQDRIVDL